MPQLIYHIDAIARKKGRDVVFVTFPECDVWRLGKGRPKSYERCAARKTIIHWLDENHIGWEPCASIAREDSMESYAGQIYIDVPYDPDDVLFQKLTSFLENPDGTIKNEGAKHWHLPLELAMKNKHHDEPGFWEKWVENF
jgi:hypothetical protein